MSDHIMMVIEDMMESREVFSILDVVAALKEDWAIADETPEEIKEMIMDAAASNQYKDFDVRISTSPDGQYMKVFVREDSDQRNVLATDFLGNLNIRNKCLSSAGIKPNSIAYLFSVNFGTALIRAKKPTSHEYYQLRSDSYGGIEIESKILQDLEGFCGYNKFNITTNNGSVVIQTC